MKRRCSFHEDRLVDDSQQSRIQLGCEADFKEENVAVPARRARRVSLLRSSSNGCDSTRGRGRQTDNDAEVSKEKARRRSANDLALDIGDLAFILCPTKQEPLVKSCMRVKSLEQSLKSCASVKSESINESDSVSLPVKRQRSKSMIVNECAPERRVNFQNVEIHVHGRKLGDNPSVSNGPPVTIGWEVLSECTSSVDDFEMKRTFERRHTRYLLIPASVRQEMLIQVGYTKDEIEMAVRSILLEKASRRHANMFVERKTSAKLEKAVDMFEHKVKKLLPFKGRRRSDRNSLTDNKSVPLNLVASVDSKHTRSPGSCMVVKVAKAC